MITLADIEAARERIPAASTSRPASSRSRCRSSPARTSSASSTTCSAPAASRSAARATRCCSCSPEQRRRGVIAASAGNHAQGIAYHGSLLGIPVTVVMPRFAALIKVTNCRQLGATVVLHGADLGRGARARGGARRRATGLTFIHPFDNARRDRRPGHDGARDPRADARRRRDRRAGRRRRAASPASARSMKARAARRRGHRRRARARRLPHRGAGARRRRCR